jgi:transcriptional regulator with XRE-family HTH domain
MSNIDKHIGNRIKLQRKLIGLSREKLGNHIGVSSQQIQKYETGMSAIKPSNLCKIAEILSVSPNYFFDTYVTASSQAKVATTYDEILNQEETLELINFYYRIKDFETRKSLITFLEKITKTSAISAFKFIEKP